MTTPLPDSASQNAAAGGGADAPGPPREGPGLLSIVVPAFQEEGNVEPLYERVCGAVPEGVAWELVLVDDGSTDATLAQIRALAERDERVRFVSLSRNFGHQPALKAGLDHARGDCIVTMDADLQHPPELIAELLERWRQGFDVAYTVRRDVANVSGFKKVTARLFYWLLNKLSGLEISRGAADFRILDRKVADVLRGLPERFLFYRGLVAYVGFRQIAIPYVPDARHAGETKYSLRRMIQFAIIGITSFSIRPLRLALVLGVGMSALAAAYGLYAVGVYLVTDDAIAGWASTVVVVTLIGGIQLAVLGVIGEYLGKLFLEAKERPVYIVRETNALPEEDGP